MTTVSCTIKLMDAMSGPLKKITSAMNGMISTMDRMQSSASRAGKIGRSLAAAQQQVASAEAGIARAIDQKTKAQNKFNSAMKQFQKTVMSKPPNNAVNQPQTSVAAMSQTNAVNQSPSQGGGLLSGLKKAAGANLSFDKVKEFVGAMIDGGIKQQSQIDALTARTGNPAQGQAIFNQVSAQALKYGQDVDSALKGTRSFMSNTKDPAKLGELSMMAMRLARLNPEEGMSGAVSAMKDLMSGDSKSIAENFNMNQSLVQNSAAQRAGQNGDIDGFIKGMDELLNSQNMTQNQFESMLDSPAAKWTRIIETFKFKMASVGRDILSAIEPLLNIGTQAIDSGAFDNFITGLQIGLKAVSFLLSELVSGAVWLFNVIQQGGPVVTGVLTFISGVLLVMMIQKLWAMIPALIANIANLWAMVSPILAQAAAWMIANWPILLVIAAIALLVGILVYFGVSAQQVVGAVVGFFYALYAAIMNQIAQLWNIVASFVEFLINVFIDPVYAIKKLIYDLAQTFGGYLYNMLVSAETFAGGFMKVIISAINKVLQGYTWLADKINKIFGTDLKGAELFDEGNIHAVSDSLKNIMNSMEAPTSDKNVVSIPRMKQQNVADSFQKGYSIGYNSTDNLLKKAPGLLNGLEGIPPVDNAAGKYDLGNIDRVGQVDQINGTVDVSSEDLKTMRDLAEMNNIQNFVTLTPTLSFGDTHVQSPSDIDTIISRITTKLEEQIVSSAQGVYG